MKRTEICCYSYQYKLYKTISDKTKYGEVPQKAKICKSPSKSKDTHNHITREKTVKVSQRMKGGQKFLRKQKMA
jgi:hypothetical protein